MKTCKACGVIKPLDGFYRHPHMADGFLNKCKKCHDRESTLRRNTPNGKIVKQRADKRWVAANPEKRKAHNALARSVSTGIVEKPDKCEECGRDGYVLHGHHDDYEKRLEVEWLCPPCHAARHKESNDLYIARLNRN